MVEIDTCLWVKRMRLSELVQKECLFLRHSDQQAPTMPVCLWLTPWILCGILCFLTDPQGCVPQDFDKSELLTIQTGFKKEATNSSGAAFALRFFKLREQVSHLISDNPSACNVT